MYLLVRIDYKNKIHFKFGCLATLATTRTHLKVVPCGIWTALGSVTVVFPAAGQQRFLTAQETANGGHVGLTSFSSQIQLCSSVPHHSHSRRVHHSLFYQWHWQVDSVAHYFSSEPFSPPQNHRNDWVTKSLPDEFCIHAEPCLCLIKDRDVLMLVKIRLCYPSPPNEYIIQVEHIKQDVLHLLKQIKRRYFSSLTASAIPAFLYVFLKGRTHLMETHEAVCVPGTKSAYWCCIKIKGSSSKSNQ